MIKVSEVISDFYLRVVKEGKIRKEPFQKEALIAFDFLFNEVINSNKFSFFKKKNIRGIYLHGKPGGGKSYLMGLFIDSLKKYDPSRKIRRVHFHDFMVEIQNSLKDKRLEKKTDPLSSVANDISKNIHILCFDELEVRDITDAMILSRFFSKLIFKHTIIIATSNCAPDELYKNGLQRALFIPFIELIKKKMNIIEILNSKDFRVKKTLNSKDFYYFPLNQNSSKKLSILFKKLSKNKKISSIKVNSRGRVISFQKASNNILYTEFKDICEKEYSAYDYIQITLKFK